MLVVIRRRRSRKARIYRQPREFRITRVCSTNNALGGTPIFLSTDGSGRQQFTFGTTSPINTTYFGLQFALSSFTAQLPAGVTSYVTPGYSDFTNMFDEYLIEGVSVMVLASYNLGVTMPTNSSNVNLPFVVHATDPDDAAAQPWSSLVQKSTARYTQFTQMAGEPKPLRKFRPRPATSLYQTGLSFAYGAAQETQYINCAYPDVPHYGMKFALDDSFGTYPLNQNMAQLNIVVKFYFRFRGTQ